MNPRDLLATARPTLEAATAASREALAQQLREGEIVITPGRNRPLYFDGRFLTAADLTADQQYIRHRLADLGRALGSGVIAGLRVQRDSVNGRAGVRISAGHGLTPSGELVMLPQGDDGLARFVAFDDLETQQRVELQLGLRAAARPTTASRRLRSGLFVLALRPVEFSANPVPAYPTSLDGARSVRDGDTVEAVAITLLPYVDRSPANATAQQRRAQVAREVFYERSGDTQVVDALPLAVLQFESGRLLWLDEHLARREVGTESGLAVTLNPRPRAVLESWFAQYAQQLADQGDALATPFPAAQLFSALPPVGPLPIAALDWQGGFGAGLRQSWFPPEAEVDFSFVPEDELPALVDEALALPPIDLRADAASLDQLSLLILAPVPRATLVEIRRNLASARLPTRLATPARVAPRNPLASLVQLGGWQPPLAIRPVATLQSVVAAGLIRPLPAPPTIDAAWQSAFATARRVAQERHGGMFWYLRRRQLPYASEPAGTTLRLAGTAAQLDGELQTRLQADETAATYAEVSAAAPLLSRAELLNTLASPRLALSPTLSSSGRLAVSDLLRRSAVAEVLATAGESDAGLADPSAHDKLLRIGERYGSDRLGEGLDRVLAAAPELAQPQLAAVLSASRVVPQLDRHAADLPDEAVASLGRQLVDLAGRNQVEGIGALLR